MLRKSRIHPHISAYDSIHVKLDFNKTPLAPREPESSSIINRENARVGTQRAHTGGTSEQRGTTTGSMSVMYRKQEVSATAILLIFSFVTHQSPRKPYTTTSFKNWMT